MLAQRRPGFLRLALLVGGLLFLFWGVFMLFFPGTGHDMMASAQPFDRSTTQMFGGALLALALAAFMALRDPWDNYREVVHFLTLALVIIFIVAFYSLLVGDMDANGGTLVSLVVVGLVAIGTLIWRP